MKSKKELKKTNLIGLHQINTEKLYLFRRMCEEACTKKFSGSEAYKNLFRHIPRWPELQSALRLVEIYEESSIEELRNQLHEEGSVIKTKIISHDKGLTWGSFIPENQLWDKLFDKKIKKRKNEN